ncbi:hypothetical protein Pcar_1379 [Syntrophotalea carbinolica DSM 2380]|uniref:Uncharacterized protein n=1 Tax=Syntrophotalea carbinolica (strain DSM 2380 / NBRC 103641 / GraBd1) TaxID=338963 RepID=Q3A4T1_SYNC1|nr:hypothetical protein [Syntrophotalea carbinolica]ABA88626.1 hypothetical protein Pcar_1379 [Syntrophotalea carbinolica DSM 2380]
MNTWLNSPDKIIANLRGAPERMHKVDSVLGDRTFTQFSEAIAKILRHSEVEQNCINQLLPRELGADVCINLFSAAAEFETGINVLRLSNAPASQRQGRVASELIALSILIALPDKLIRRLPPKLQLVKKLSENPGKKVVDLYKTQMTFQGRKPIRIEPQVKGNMIYPAFLSALRNILNAPCEIVENLKLYRETVQHPASHASLEVGLFHFEGFDGGRSGATFMEERTDTYKNSVKDLTNLAIWHARALDATYRFLKDSEDA